MTAERIEADGQPPSKLVTVVGIAHGLATATAYAAVRRDFAGHHLRAAARAARKAGQIEQANSMAEWGDWFEEMLEVVPISVMMAAAALEANASEIIQDILDGALPVSPSREILVKDLKDSRSGNSMDKYRQLALLFDKLPAPGSAKWGAAALLVRFRNGLTHFKPEWDDNSKDGDLNKSLQNRLRPNRFFPSPSASPYAFITYECAAWSVKTVLDFSAEFAILMGVKDRFAANRIRFALS